MNRPCQWMNCADPFTAASRRRFCVPAALAATLASTWSDLHFPSGALARHEPRSQLTWGRSTSVGGAGRLTEVFSVWVSYVVPAIERCEQYIRQSVLTSSRPGDEEEFPAAHGRQAGIRARRRVSSDCNHFVIFCSLMCMTFHFFVLFRFWGHARQSYHHQTISVFFFLMNKFNLF